MTTMAPTPRPAGWKGGSEDFGFLRTFDGHVAPDLVGSGAPDDDHMRFGNANVRWGFEEADIGGRYCAEPSYSDYPDPPDTHNDDLGSA